MAATHAARRCCSAAIPATTPDETYATWQQGARTARRARPGRRPHAALPAGRRRGGRGRHRRSSLLCSGAVDDRSAAPRGGTAGRRRRRGHHAGVGRLGATPGCGSLELPAGGTVSSTPGGDEVLVAAAVRRRATVTCDGEHGRRCTAGRDVFAGADRLRLPAAAAPSVASTSADGGRFAVPRRRRPRPGLPSRYAPADEVPVELRGAGRASRQVQQLRRRRTSFDCRPAHRRARCSRPAATGRRTRRTSTTSTARRRVASSRRSTTSRSARRRTARRTSAVYGTGAGPADRRARRGAHRRRRARPARLARPVDGGARLRPLLPQRDGRARRRRGPG